MRLRLKTHRAIAREIAAHSEGSGGAVRLAFGEMVPAHLLDGGELVHFSIRPSPWFVVIESIRWFLFSAVLIGMVFTGVIDSNYHQPVTGLAIALAAMRAGWASLEWVSRMYVLTNRRVMSIHGVFRAELFECALDRIQTTQWSASLGEKTFGVGTVSFQPRQAEGVLGGAASWRTVARPQMVHDKLVRAIERAQNPG